MHFVKPKDIRIFKAREYTNSLPDGYTFYANSIHLHLGETIISNKLGLLTYSKRSVHLITLISCELKVSVVCGKKSHYKIYSQCRKKDKAPTYYLFKNRPPSQRLQFLFLRSPLQIKLTAKQ